MDGCQRMWAVPCDPLREDPKQTRWITLSRSGMMIWMLSWIPLVVFISRTLCNQIPITQYWVHMYVLFLFIPFMIGLLVLPRCGGRTVSRIRQYPWLNPFVPVHYTGYTNYSH